jgi:large subunit ribosomal protein L35
MPKTKSNSGAKKRFKLTGTGEIKRKHAFKNHILTKKEKKRKRALRKFATVHPTEKKNILALIS